jgi:ADP-ribosyl-[dinitrogen reductase] hydrolase
MKLSTAQTDRAAGVLLGMACGDALGAGYEFGPPLPDDTVVTMKGGGGFGWAPGEWTDDTSMAIPITRAIAAGRDLREETVLDDIVAQWVDWAKTAPDVGIQLRAVLGNTAPTAAAIRVIAREHHERHGRSAGNGSLMRTAPVALAYLDDPHTLAAVARDVSSLTHFEEDAGDACVLWCLAIRHAVLTGELDVRIGLQTLPPERRELWGARIEAAEAFPPSHFARNGWVVEAFQGAWSSTIERFGATDTGDLPADQLRLSLECAVRGGRDTDTVAAIAGGLLGAAWGASAVPAEWRRVVHGWPGLSGAQLVRLGLQAAKHGAGGDRDWPGAKQFDYSSYGNISELARHPHDDGVWLGGVGNLARLPAGVTAVVSLCRVGTAQVPTGLEHVEVWLIDEEDPALNPNLDFVLRDTADAVATLRAQGHVVFLHCVQAISRTPTIAALYSARHLGIPIEAALADVRSVLPLAHPNPTFTAALRSHDLDGSLR